MDSLPSVPGVVLVLTGPPGAGKSTVAELVASSAGRPTVHLHTDDFYTSIRTTLPGHLGSTASSGIDPVRWPCRSRSVALSTDRPVDDHSRPAFYAAAGGNGGPSGQHAPRRPAIPAAL
jgi:hypothetical protein